MSPAAAAAHQRWPHRLLDDRMERSQAACWETVSVAKLNARARATARGLRSRSLAKAAAFSFASVDGEQHPTDGVGPP